MKGNNKFNSIWPILISLVAFVVSAITFYMNYIAPFDPLVTVGGAVYQFANVFPTVPGLNSTFTDEFDPNHNRILGAILIPIVFTHDGGKSGVISDVMLRVTRDGQMDNWLFEPRLNVDERAYLTSFEPKSHLKWIESAFSPIPLAKGSQERRFIIFQGNDNPVFLAGRLRVGHYVIHVLIRINDEQEFREVDKIAVDFSSNVLKSLDIERYIPSPESILERRNKLK